jgi:hypothetical protein
VTFLSQKMKPAINRSMANSRSLPRLGGMAARYRSGYLVPGGVKRSHAEALATWNAFTWNRSTSQTGFSVQGYRDISSRYPTIWPTHIHGKCVLSDTAF